MKNCSVVIFRSLFVSCAFIMVAGALAQNIVNDDETDIKLPPVALLEGDLEKIIKTLPPTDGRILGREAERIAEKCERHIKALIAEWPLMPFHHTLGISGYEVYFNHPDQLFYSLSIALPFLSEKTRDAVKSFLERQVTILPPYSVEGYDNRMGKPRESYDVPMNLRIQGRGKAGDCFGIYSFWTWCHFTKNTNATLSHWDAIKGRIKPLLATDYKFDVYKTDYSKDEAEHLNGDLAGLIGFVRLARMNNDVDALVLGQKRILELLNLRVNLERVNPKISTKTSATKSLHIYKLARYCNLVPEIGEALRLYCDGVAEKRVSAYRSARNGWYMAFGDRFIGGENYTNPLHFGRALFTAAATIEKLPPETLAGFVDVPHCAGDLYFIERCALVLRAFSISPRE